ncbi:hypothetical protein ACJMK2_020034 [Sinanodonta woodiana]|uniref:Zinc finger BED domain-containing protein 5 n=1 Tax=Sinanodonta woodiana TaxID=1069815 RepID=A0ABD3TZY9_SINWO
MKSNETDKSIKNIKYGFIASGSEDAHFPFCLICNAVLSKEELIPNKLKRHVETKHPAVKDKQM